MNAFRHFPNQEPCQKEDWFCSSLRLPCTYPLSQRLTTDVKSHLPLNAGSAGESPATGFSKLEA